MIFIFCAKLQNLFTYSRKICYGFVFQALNLILKEKNCKSETKKLFL